MDFIDYQITDKNCIFWMVNLLRFALPLWLLRRGVSLNLDNRPLNCRGGCYFWLDPKVTKKSSQQRGFLAARGLCPANQVKPGLQTVALLRSLNPNSSANICYALPLHNPPLFYLISPEAYLLTGTEEFTIINKKADIKSPRPKAREGLLENRAGSMALRAEGFFQLDFLVLFHQGKRTSPPAAMSGTMLSFRIQYCGLTMQKIASLLVMTWG